MAQIANVLRPMLANPSPNHRADNHRELIVALLHKKLLFNSLHSHVHFSAIYFYMFECKKKKKKLVVMAWEAQSGEEELVRVAGC